MELCQQIYMLEKWIVIKSIPILNELMIAYTHSVQTSFTKQKTSK